MKILTKIIKDNYDSRNNAIVLIKFLAILMITNSHLDCEYGHFNFIARGGALGNCLFFFASGFTLFLGRFNLDFFNWYKRRVSRIIPAIIVLSCIVYWLSNVNFSIPKLLEEYWFLTCILVYYIPLYFIRKYLVDYLKYVFALCLIIAIAANFIIHDNSIFDMYYNLPYMRVHYFLFMLLGSIMAMSKNKEEGQKWHVMTNLVLFVLSFVLYLLLVWLCQRNQLLCKNQFVTLFPLLFSVYFCWNLSNCPFLVNFVHRPLCGRIIYFVSTLSLEVYIIQGLYFIGMFNGQYFPLNIIVIFGLLFLSSYILKILSNMFIQLFGEQTFNWKKMIQV